MNIIVCIKQVPDTTDVKIDKKTGTLIREGVPSIVNPDDKFALEAALRLKDEKGGRVTVVSMGPPQADDALRECSAMGADDLILLSDREFAGADTLATSYTIATCIKKIGGYDVIFCGRQAIDGDTAQIGPQVAEYLGVPQITYVRKLELKDGKIIAERELEDGFEKVEAPTPALLTFIKGEFKPRYPTMGGIADAYREKDVKVWTAKDIGAESSQIGSNGSPTWVHRTFAPEPKGEGQMLQGSKDEVARSLLAHLLDDNVLREV